MSQDKSTAMLEKKASRPRRLKKSNNEIKTPFSWKEFKKQWFLMLCSAIFVAYGVLFYYVPILGWAMAFENYKPKTGIFGSKFVFLDKFIFLFSDDTFINASVELF